MFWHIGEILVRKKLITWDQLEDALEEQKRTKEFTGEILVHRKYISRPLLYKNLAEQYNMRFIDLKRTKINSKAIELIPRSVAEKYSLMPIEFRQESLLIGISNPLNIWPEVELKKLTKIEDIRTVLCLPDDIHQTIKEYYPTEESVKMSS